MAFCNQCGNAIQPPASTSFSGRPVISMDPRKQGQVSETSVGHSAQMPQNSVSPHPISNIQPAQFQSSPIPPQVAIKSSNSSKIAIGAVGILISIVALVFLLGRKDSESPIVAPSNQQSGSSSGQTSDEFVEDYESYDDYSYEFRSEYMDACTVEGAYDFCLCTLENMESIYTIDELGIIYDSGEDITWFYEQIRSGCY